MALEIDLGPSARAFRDEVRGWLEANRPDELIGVEAERAEPRASRSERHERSEWSEWSARPGASLGNETPALKAWSQKLHEAGFMCVSWPKEYGGRGLSGVEVAVLNEEFARAQLPRVTRGMGEWLVGPSIIVHGTDEQKATFLPRIIDGTDRYCQGFSEPDAGSDLAGLKTRGEVDGDELVITGQKVWTSGAHLANMMFCLCRTDGAPSEAKRAQRAETETRGLDVPKHRGISYVLLPMRREDGSSNGIELRPIKQITGQSHFFETFIEGARAPLANIIGGLNNGWRVTMTTLGNERGGNATTQHVQYTKQFWQTVDLARKLGKVNDPLVRQDLAWAFTHCEIMRYQGLKTLSEVVARKEPGPASSINKMFWSEYAQRFAEIIVNMQGLDGVARLADIVAEQDKWQTNFLSTRSVTIWGGTAQVQRNIVGERVLGLPKEPATNVTAPATNVTAPAANVTAPATHVPEPAANVTAPAAHVTAPATHVPEPATHVPAPSPQ